MGYYDEDSKNTAIALQRNAETGGCESKSGNGKKGEIENHEETSLVLVKKSVGSNFLLERKHLF